MPEMPTDSEAKTGVLEAPSALGGSFYKDPNNSAEDILDSLFGDTSNEPEDGAGDDLEEDPHTDNDLQPTPTRATQKPAAKQTEPESDERFTRMEEMLAQMQAQNERLQQALLQKDLIQQEPPQEEEPPLTEPEALDEEDLRMFQMGDPDATKKFINWVKDVASYQAAKGLDNSLPKRVEKTLNTLTTNQGQLAARVETWWEKNGEKVKAVGDGKPFTAAMRQLEESGKVSHKYIEAQLDRLLQHVEEQAALYGAPAPAPTNGAKPKSKPTGPVTKGFRPTTGGASRRAPASAAESEREAANSVDALLGNRALTSFHM